MATSLIWSSALNAVSLLCLLSGIYFAVQFHRKPLLTWDVPLHLSYQNIGTVGHSSSLARYDAEFWNHAVQLGGGLVAAITLVAFQHHRHQYSKWTAILGHSPKTSTNLKEGRFGLNFSKMGISTFLVCIALGAEVASTLLGMHTATWTTTSPIGAVSTAAITSELTRVPAVTPWDMGSVMLRSAFEHVVSQKGFGALEVTHRYLSRHLRDGEGVRIGRTVYPSIRTHGVGVAPALWERKGYRIPVDQGRVLVYEPVVAATNVTVQCSDSTEDWAWGYEVLEIPSQKEPDSSPTIVHRFHVAPKLDWNTRGASRTVTYLDGNKGINLETWLALEKIGTDSESANDMPTHQIFLFTNVGAINRAPKVTVIDCVYGGFDVIRQVTMASPLEPISIGDIMATKNALTMADLYPAAVAIDEALDRDGGAMVAGMAAGKMTSFEVWDLFRGRTLKLPDLIEHVLVDTTQAYFSLVRQWREEARFSSWPREIPAGHLTVKTRRIGWDGGTAGMGGLVVLGLLILLPLTALTRLSRGALRDYSRRRHFVERFELKDGVIKKKSE
ncbi:hypothetical protein B0T21DRAFT_371687 [Apiosordaria backusii]|uniref:Uncharacterized protein n=1 Tax=Apiosordaria backusii TaxID=314023 RepID=A0AA40B2J9_9PEZI|nr:hypothetical protein B0T21DRAFT_371687 [Apiosordaria backusii]